MMRYKTLLLTLIAFSAVAFSTPRLTVVVIVDGLTEDNLVELRPYWSQGGLRTLSEEAWQSTLSFPQTVYGGDETTATLMSGTTPSHHGIEANQYFSRNERTVYPILFDRQTAGIGTKEQISPKGLVTTSLTDEWRLRFGADAKIYAIGLNSTTTVLMAGHAANACCWLQPDSQRWVSTSFYKEGLPAVADQMNMSGRIREIGAVTWVPRLDVGMYAHPTNDEKKHSFAYLQNRYLHHCPGANTLVMELALKMQQSAQMGRDNVPDILLLEMTTRSPQAKSDAIMSAEQEDIYLHLNQDLGFLMEQLNNRIGKTQYQMVVVGRPCLGYSADYLQSAGLQVAHFDVDRASALTATYLMALYGHERWVDGGFGPYIYLNRTLIEQRQLNLETIQRQVANFLMDFQGVQLAYPIHEALLTEDKTGIYRKYAGDVYLKLEDNYVLYSSEKQIMDHVIQSNPTAPLLWWCGITRSFPTQSLNATDIKQLILQ